MSESEEKPQVERKRSGAGGAFAVLLSLLAVSVSGYLFYREIYSDPLASVLPTIEALQAAQERTAADVLRQMDVRLADPEQPLARQLATHETRMTAVQQELGHLRGLIAVSDIDPRPWRLAEASHLIRLARNSLQVSSDVASASNALRAARAVLVDLDDPSLAPAVAAIDRDLAELERVPRIDVDAVVLRLQALQSTLPELPIRLPSYSPPEASPEAPAEGWRLALDRLTAMFKFRQRESGATHPLLEPAEHRYLELNLSMALERAQLGLLRRDAEVFDQSLDGFAAAINEFYDSGDDRVSKVLTEVASLRGLKITAELPEIDADADFSKVLLIDEVEVDEVEVDEVDTPEAATTGSEAQP